MAEYNMTDKEQIDMIRKWWKDYGKIIAVAVVIGLLAAFAWRAWHQHKLVQVQKAAALYSRLGVLSNQYHAQAAEAIAANLTQHYQHTAYATLAALWWGQQLLNDEKYNQALQKFKWVFKNSDVKSFRQIARIRASRILLFQKKPEAALVMLKGMDSETYQPLIEEVKGDIYLVMKKPGTARKAYKLAQSVLKAEGMNAPILEMKVAQP